MPARRVAITAAGAREIRSPLPDAPAGIPIGSASRTAKSVAFSEWSGQAG